MCYFGTEPGIDAALLRWRSTACSICSLCMKSSMYCFCCATSSSQTCNCDTVHISETIFATAQISKTSVLYPHFMKLTHFSLGPNRLMDPKGKTDRPEGTAQISAAHFSIHPRGFGELLPLATPFLPLALPFGLLASSCPPGMDDASSPHAHALLPIAHL